MSSPFLSYAIYYSCNYRANLEYAEKIVCYIGIADFGVFNIKMRNCQMLMNRTHSTKLQAFRNSFTGNIIKGIYLIKKSDKVIWQITLATYGIFTIAFLSTEIQ